MGGRGSGSGGNPPQPPEPPQPPTNDDPTQWSFDQLQNYINAHPDDDDEALTTKVEQWLAAHRSASTTTIKDDEMTVPEDFYSITVKNGIQLLFTPGNERNAADTIIEMVIGFDTLPGRLKSEVATIIMAMQTSGDIVATAGTNDKNIVVYGGNPLSTGTVGHEAAHNLALDLWGRSNPPHYAEGTDMYYEIQEQGLPVRSDYGDAIESGEPPVSAYGRTNDSEDFAEAVKMYVINRTQLQQIAPRRYAVIHALMTNAGYGG